MDNKSQFLSVVCAYIKQYIKVLFLFIVFAFVFCIVFSLYNLETEAIYYSIILCAFIGLIYICINFINYYKNIFNYINYKRDFYIIGKSSIA